MADTISFFTISFFVAGVPQPKGSTRAFVKDGRAVTTSSNRNLKQWELRIAHEAQAAVPEGFCDGESAYSVDCTFRFMEPKGHAKGFCYCHTKRPDVDKLARAVLDALTGICWKDDAQVTFLTCDKAYGESPSVTVEISKEPGRSRL